MIMTGFFFDLVHALSGRTKFFLATASLAAAAVSCDKIGAGDPDGNIPSVQSEVTGFYVLNEGTMGMNNASLDFVNLRTGEYVNDWFSQQNPEMSLELGDVGNDILIAGDYLIIVLNGSGLLEIADALTARHIAEVPVPDCRYVIENDGYLYVTSYAEGGSLYKVSTEDFSMVSRIGVGHDPEQLHFHDGFIYVLNSGGLQYDPATGTTAYEQTVSVVDAGTFEVVRTDDTGYRNLYKVICAGDVEYMTSRGDYGADPGAVFSYDRGTGKTALISSVPVSNWCCHGGTVYTQSTTYDENWNPGISFGTLSDGVYQESEFLDLSGVGISSCYGLDINPSTGDFVLTDAGDYTTPGTVHYFHADGTLLWSHVAGVCPSRIAWIYGAE